MSSRACLRCISKKRKCDHKRPSCGLCSKLSLGCEYPPPQARRGPVAGLGKKAEARVQQCENALWWVLAIPEVAELVRRHADNTPLPKAPTARLERIARAGWWDEHGVRTRADVLGFLDSVRELGDDADSEEPSVSSFSPRSHRDELDELKREPSTPRLPSPPARHHALPSPPAPASEARKPSSPYHARQYRSPAYPESYHPHSPTDPHLYQQSPHSYSPPPSYAQCSHSPLPPPHALARSCRGGARAASPKLEPKRELPKRELQDDDDVPRHEIRRPALWNLIAAADRDDWRSIKRQRTVGAGANW